ncbi:hypothetical protein TSUD_398740 [Trifolium subterraneum]|uniref:DNA topoisomerase (ATP-hydrolyzing) n=1 Tax=Trifolium subterraneum TaxID=3900 RepID=A0A2Z6NDA5_TRISU|nr:hypothetical protein TSUD_398740 [Trifolium subterraneum]
MGSRFADGGLGIRSLSKLNQASNLKIFWELANSDNHWARVLRSRVTRSSRFISHNIFSSIWSDIKEYSHVILDNTTWLLGNGTTIKFWIDNWSGTPLVNLLNLSQHTHKPLQTTISEFIIDHQWSVPLELQNLFPNLLNHLNKNSIPIEDKNDKMLWMQTTSGDVSLKEAYPHFSPTGISVSWAKVIWNLAIPPSKSFMVWRLFHNKLATDENLSPSITNFEVLKFFKINIHHSNAPKNIEVIWNPPLQGWVKCNMDDTSLGNPGPTAYAATKSIDIVPWQIKNRWMNCLALSRQMQFIISPVYREGNYCADKLASLGITLNAYTWWSSPPLCIRDDLTRNRLGLPSFSEKIHVKTHRKTFTMTVDERDSIHDSREDDVSNIPKLEDANLAVTQHSKKCTLILTEGDSAKSLVDVMLENIESDLVDTKNTIEFVKLARGRKFDFFTKDIKDLQGVFIGFDDYQSLLSLPLSTFLNEGLKKLEDEIRDKEAEKNALFNKTETQLQEDDLNTFKEE